MNAKSKRSGKPLGAVGAGMIESAREDGRKARLAGKRRDECPILSDYPVKGCREVWLAGWDEAAPKTPGLPVRTPEDRMQIQTRGAPVSDGVERWPESEPLPEVYRMRPPVPCQKCRATVMASKHQAVVCLNTADGFAYLSCRCCGAKFKRRLA